MNIFKRAGQHSHLYEFLLVTFVVLTLDYIFIMRYGFGISLGHWMIAFFNVALVVSIISFIKNYKRRFVAYILYILVMFTFFVTDSTLYFFKQDVTSIAMLIESGKNTMRIGLKYNPLFAYNIFIWLAITAFVYIGIRGLYSITKLQNPVIPMRRIRQFVFLGVSIIGLSLSSTLISEEDELTFDTTSDKSLFVQKFGSITYHMRDLVTFTSNAFKPILYREDYVEEINQRVTTELAPQTDLFGMFEGKNVIMIMCETCEDYAFDPNHTPNYYRLRDQSTYFTRFYSAAKTDYTYDSEFKSLTSMMYFQADNFMYSHGENYYPSALPNMLRSHGYTANSFHDYYATFFNRDMMHQSMGFESFKGVEEMVIEEGDYWPLDSMMFEQFIDDIAPIQEDPFFSFIITVTPHGPHNKYRDELENYYQMLDQDPLYVDQSLELRTLMAAQMDFDKGLGIMLDHLEANQMMNDTVIVMFSDHKNYSSLPITMEQTPNSEVPYEVDKLPFLIYGTGMTPGPNDTLTSHYDIAPTLMDLLGVPYYQDLYYGQSIFSNERLDRPIITSHSNWITLTHMVQFDEVVQGELSEEALIEMKFEIYEIIDLFEMMMFSDYFSQDNPFFEVLEPDA